MYLSPHRTKSSVDKLETVSTFPFTCSLPCLYSHLVELSATSVPPGSLHQVASCVLICYW
jgi:pyruvate-formate lyase-activating enzyme